MYVQTFAWPLLYFDLAGSRSKTCIQIRQTALRIQAKNCWNSSCKTETKARGTTSCRNTCHGPSNQQSSVFVTLPQQLSFAFFFVELTTSLPSRFRSTSTSTVPTRKSILQLLLSVTAHLQLKCSSAKLGWNSTDPSIEWKLCLLSSLCTSLHYNSQTIQLLASWTVFFNRV